MSGLFDTNNNRDAPGLENVFQKIAQMKANVDKSPIDDDRERSLLADFLKELLILRMPTHDAIKNDIHVILWNTCFYENRIKVLRGQTTTPKAPNDNAFKEFLVSSIVFYKAMINNYKSSDHFKSQKENSTDTPTYSRDHDPTAVLLNHFNLRLGDLHRYNNDFKEAEKFYRQAISLHPDIDHPYNQIAVINVERGLLLDALYYFVRGGSLSNMAQCFRLNSKSLSSAKKSCEYNKLSSTAGKIGQNIKSKVIKLFLSEYIDIHRIFFTFSTPNNDFAENSNIDQLHNSSGICLKHLAYLLKEGQLSESMLKKMIVINIFNVVFLNECILEKPTEKMMDFLIAIGEQDQIKAKSMPSIALKFAYSFGTVLIEQFKKSVMNRNEEEKELPDEKRLFPHSQSLRYFMVLQLFCDWLSTVDTPGRLTNHSGQYVSEQAALAACDEQRNFNVSIVSLWNELNDSDDYAASLGKGKGNIIANHGNGLLKFKEHFDLRGFSPFFHFVSQESQKTMFTLDGEHELQRRIQRLFQFVSSCQGLAMNRDGRFHLRTEDQYPEEEIADDHMCKKVGDSCFVDKSNFANAKDSKSVEVNEADQAGNTGVYQSPPNIAQKFITYHASNDCSDAIIPDVDNGNFTSAVSAHSEASPDVSNLQSSTDEPTTPPLLRNLASSSPMNNEPISNQHSLINGKACMSQWLLHAPHLSSKALTRFISAASANPFDAKPPSATTFKEKPPSPGSNSSPMCSQHATNRIISCDAAPHCQRSKNVLVQFLGAVQSNPFEKQWRPTPVGNLNRNSERCNDVSTSTFHTSLTKFVKHNNPQSLLFDYHPGLSMAEHDSRNALILYGQADFFDQELDSSTRKRQFPFRNKNK